MTLLVTPSNRHRYATLLDQYFQLRHKVFNEWQHWNLESRDGRETDQFDRLDTVYILALGDNGQVAGGARLIPTTGEYMISSVFPEIWEEQEIPHEHGIWEMSRFVVDWDAYKHIKGKVREVSGDIGCAIAEFCMLDDIRELVAILDIRFEPRVTRTFGEPIWKSATKVLGGVSSVGARYAISYQYLQATRERFRLPAPSIQQFAEVSHGTSHRYI